MQVKGWKIADFLVFFVMTIVAVLVAKAIGDAIPAVGKVTSRI